MRGGWWLIAGVLAAALQCAAAATPAAYVAAAHAERVPPDILFALACAESGRPMADGRTLPWPWVLNVGGDGQFFATRAAAHEALVQVLTRSTNVDVGLGQINWYWHRERFADTWQALDPYVNLRTAARLLREQFDRCACDDWWRAVERYHAPSETSNVVERRSRYRANVERCWQSHAL
jgi:hypothetical protein